MGNPSFFRRSLLRIAVASFFIGIGGCTSNSTSSEGQIHYVTSGTAAKGIVQHGLIEVYELDANGNSLRLVGKTTTNAQGQYEATLDDRYDGGILLIKLKAGPETKMICDVQGSSCNFGEAIGLDSDFELEALVPPPEQGNKIKAQVTPVAAMAAARARALGAIDERNVERALAEVSELVGVDILTTPPADITRKTTGDGNDDGIVYAAFLAGIGKIALEPENGGLQAGLEKFAESFADGKFDPADPVRLDALITEVTDQANKTGIQSARLSSRLAIVQAELDANDGVFDPEPGNSNGDTNDVAKAKALIGDLRSWVDSIEKLESPASAFGDEVDTVTTLLDPEATALTAQYTSVVEAVVTALENRLAAGTSIGSWLVPVGTAGSVTVVGTESANGASYAVSNPQGLPNLSGLSLLLETSLKSADLKQLLNGQPVTANGLVLGIQGEITSTNVRMSIDNMKLDATFAGNYRFDPTANDATPPAIQAASFDGEVEIEAPGRGVGFAGDIAIQLTQLANRNAEGVGLEEISLDGVVNGSSGKSFSSRIRLTIDNPEQIDITSNEPEKSHFAKGTLSVTVALKLVGRPDATLNLTAKRTGRTLVDVTAGLFYDHRSLTIEGRVSGQEDAAAAGGTTRFTNADGVEIVMTGASGKQRGTIKVHDRLVGIVEALPSGALIARYEDGTFESLY